MKHLYLKVLLFLLVATTSYSQVNTSSGAWTPIGDVNLTTVYDDADNGDGIGDGATVVDGQSAVSGLGAAYTFGGTMQLGEAITISTFTYNRNSSYVNFKIELFNKTDNKVLKTSSEIKIDGNDVTPIYTILSYTAVSNDVGDELQARYIRTGTSASANNTARDFTIDNLKLLDIVTIGGPCPFTVIPDLSLTPSNATIEVEINAAVNRFSDVYLGTSYSGTLTAADASYAALGVTVNSGTISSTIPITNFSQVEFLKRYAQYLKFNPSDMAVREKANNIVWLTSQYFCNGTLALNSQMYDYQKFARPASLLKDFLDPNVKNLFAYTLHEHSVGFEHFWAPTYNASYQIANGAINTDLIHNISDAMLAYSLWQNTPDERYRYMRAYKRYIDRFFSYTAGTTDGIKVDGTGFHHWVAYNNYMYAYSAAATLLTYLSGTSFQVEKANYQVFRNAFYTQFIQANDDGVQAFSTAGRNPQNRTRPIGQSALKTIAISGGEILGLSTADPILAGIYNRIYGVDAAFNYSTVTPFTEGFFQFNHAMAGAFRKGDWVVFNKGFSNNMWGSETYISQNRYGRYQSYGAQEVMYSGDKLTGNGYDDKTWDWNFNPGTTVIKLPWENLHAERGRIDEEQQKRFVGALNLKNKNSELLTNNHGDYGMFAMDFQEKTGQGFSVTHASENHNNTFTFKKSNFYFDDIIVCLGSGITNNDTSNETVTTLFQRLDNKGIGVNVNGTNQTATGLITYSGASNNWLLSNYGTGFYLVSGNGELVVKKEVQKTPNQDQIWSGSVPAGNSTATYYTGYINHGKNPSNKNYEYILKPKSNATEMQALNTAIQSANKPYTVHQKNANAHIVEHIAKNIWGYSFFNSATNLSYDKVKDVDASCLVMTEFNNSNKTLLVSIDNPDIGFNSKEPFTPAIQVTREVTLKGEWALSASYAGVQILSSNTTETVIEFTLVDGLAKEVLLNSGTLSVEAFDKFPITIYPNPTSTILNMDVSNATIQIKMVRLFDVFGKTIYTQNSTKPINIGHFSKGLYFLSLETSTGELITKKIIIN
ncbi:MAG: T9SS type A sorting domain-containing protein [Lutibacter sp.]|nr:T9SS type A sorting domain-containing protein [Lutibacter sp.]